MALELEHRKSTMEQELASTSKIDEAAADGLHRHGGLPWVLRSRKGLRPAQAHRRSTRHHRRSPSSAAHAPARLPALAQQQELHSPLLLPPLIV